jgi:hypothetical protein
MTSEGLAAANDRSRDGVTMPSSSCRAASQSAVSSSCPSGTCRGFFWAEMPGGERGSGLAFSSAGFLFFSDSGVSLTGSVLTVTISADAFSARMRFIMS